LSKEQKEDETLKKWWKMAQENKSCFFIENDLLFRSERILGHSFKQLCVPQWRRKVVLDIALIPLEHIWVSNAPEREYCFLLLGLI